MMSEQIKAQTLSRLVNEEDPQWKPPVVEAECPSCGTRRQRRASSWQWRTDGTLRARIACEPLNADDPKCWRVFDITLITDTPTNGGTTNE